jgi:hypothetical protein
MLHHVISQKLTDISEVLTAAITALMMMAVSTSEMFINFYRTECAISHKTVIFMFTART